MNPMIAEGQVTGGIAQGIGGALYEEMIYGPDGQPRTGTHMDYLVPTSSEIPDLDMDEIFTSSPLNDLGVKGLGEGGAIAPQAALANAGEDALRPFGAVVRRGPLLTEPGPRPDPRRHRAPLSGTRTTDTAPAPQHPPNDLRLDDKQMQLDHAFRVPTDPDTAWKLFLDLDRVDPCMPARCSTASTARRPRAASR